MFGGQPHIPLKSDRGRRIIRGDTTFLEGRHSGEGRNSEDTTFLGLWAVSAEIISNRGVGNRARTQKSGVPMFPHPQRAFRYQLQSPN